MRASLAVYNYLYLNAISRDRRTYATHTLRPNLRPDTLSLTYNLIHAE